MALLVEKGLKTIIGAKFGLTSQGVSQILAGKRPTSPNNRLVKSAAYEAGGLIAMDLTHTVKDMICSWADGAVQLILSKETGAVYKMINGEQTESWPSMTIEAFVNKQKECERLAAINF